MTELFRNHIFKHLRIPFAWNNVDNAWNYITQHKLEGIVLKPKKTRCKEFKVKQLIESKLKIIGLESGSQKGAFLILSPNGEVSKMSALSIGFVSNYNDIVRKGEIPFAEIEYPFLTDRGIPFQPRLRKIDTLLNLQIG